MSSGHQPISPYDNVSLAQSLTESCSIDLDFTQVGSNYIAFFLGHYEKHTNIANLLRKSLEIYVEKNIALGTELNLDYYKPLYFLPQTHSANTSRASSRCLEESPTSIHIQQSIVPLAASTSMQQQQQAPPPPHQAQVQLPQQQHSRGGAGAMASATRQPVIRQKRSSGEEYEKRVSSLSVTSG